MTCLTSPIAEMRKPATKAMKQDPRVYGSILRLCERRADYGDRKHVLEARFRCRRSENLVVHW